MIFELFSDLSPPPDAADPDPSKVVEGAPVAQSRTFYESADGRVSVGEWSCTPGRWRVRYDETEYCHILDGTGVVIDEDRSERRIAAGDEFVVPAGFVGEWHVETAMTKRYVVLLP